MIIEIENKHLKKTFEFLQSIELIGKASRVRVKLNTRLNEKLQEFSVEFNDIKTKFDELKRDEQYEELKQVLAEMNELTAEQSVIDMTEYAHLLPALKEALEDHPHELKGDEAVAHDLILDALESNLPSSDADAPNKENESVEDAQFQEVE